MARLSHHFNLFLDQTVDDALGAEEGLRLRTAAAEEASHQVVASACREANARSPADKLALASALFTAMGHGRLTIEATREGGEARATILHRSHTWLRKYGTLLRRRTPADAFAAGFAAGSTEVAFMLPRGSMTADEVACRAAGAEECQFRLYAKDGEQRAQPVGRARTLQSVGPPLEGEQEVAVATIASLLRDTIDGLPSQENGLVVAFEQALTTQLVSYSNRIAFEALHAVRERAPGSVPLFESLLRTGAHLGVVRLAGSIIRSQAWEALLGPMASEPNDIVSYCCAIARALDWGCWTILEFQPGQRLVLGTPSSHEVPFYVARFGSTKAGVAYFLQGAALAIMQLAHQVPWVDRPRFTAAFHDELARDRTWRVDQTRCLSAGHDYCELVVERR